MSDAETANAEDNKTIQPTPKVVTGFRQPKPGPALIVLGLAATITVLGGMLAFTGSSASSKNSAVLGKLKGEPLVGESSAFVIDKIKRSQQPPADVTSTRRGVYVGQRPAVVGKFHFEKLLHLLWRSRYR